MRSGAIFRIAIWASAGFLVSAGWGLYFAYSDKGNPIEPIVYSLCNWTQPVVAIAVSYVYVDVPVGLRWCLIANVVTYALLGLVVETIRQHYRPLQISK